MNYRAWNHRCWLVSYMTREHVLNELKTSRKWAGLHIADNCCFHYRREKVPTQDLVKDDGLGPVPTDLVEVLGQPKYLLHAQDLSEGGGQAYSRPVVGAVNVDLSDSPGRCLGADHPSLPVVAMTPTTLSGVVGKGSGNSPTPEIAVDFGAILTRLSSGLLEMPGKCFSEIDEVDLSVRKLQCGLLSGEVSFVLDGAISRRVEESCVAERDRAALDFSPGALLGGLEVGEFLRGCLRVWFVLRAHSDQI
ncbi:Protein prenyltransferase alpha subunit repeat-containing protein 1 [Morella rubra]|uniref:Protein prenyltransferase alpha subunit repeat-containing protein 1 n=1 Tax=Morella rubra TaxID=262757 RepID=A0A6A1V5P1_9ROSI|nr:Protein prenyltransferase alpha subunit repeat-containing protein 1 [Morella rubra]KAB1208139.1 Protein prenyltransferase alpha subunit repeat-containing protein 1 [Morella rubra]